MLLERCVPDTLLRDLSEVEQDEVRARSLPCLWRVPSTSEPFRPLVDFDNALGYKGIWCSAALA